MLWKLGLVAVEKEKSWIGRIKGVSKQRAGYLPEEEEAQPGDRCSPDVVVYIGDLKNTSSVEFSKLESTPSLV